MKKKTEPPQMKDFLKEIKRKSEWVLLAVSIRVWIKCNKSIVCIFCRNVQPAQLRLAFKNERCQNSPFHAPVWKRYDLNIYSSLWQKKVKVVTKKRHLIYSYVFLLYSRSVKEFWSRYQHHHKHHGSKFIIKFEVVKEKEHYDRWSLSSTDKIWKSGKRKSIPIPKK